MKAIRDQRLVLYLYGITESVPRAPIDQIGVDHKSKLESLPFEGLTCWVSRVSAQEFEERLAANMENLDWLASASVAHQRAISAISRHLEILPARFGTVFRSETSLRTHVKSRAADLKKDFERIRGADEFGVKVFATVAPPVAAANVRTGRDYLKAKAALLPQNRRETSDDFSEFEEALKRVAEDVAPAGNVSRGQRGLRFQTTLLVKRANRRRLESVLKKFSTRWSPKRQIECTGPWPPYSFVSGGADTISQ